MQSNEDITRDICDRTGLPRDLVRLVLSSFEDVMRESIVNTGEFKIPNVLRVRRRFIPERTALDPKTKSMKRYRSVNAITASFNTSLLNDFRNGPAHYPSEDGEDQK